MSGLALTRGSTRSRELAYWALAEDLGRKDITSELTVDEEAQALGCFVARDELVVAGLEAVRSVFFEAGGEEVRFTTLVGEGERVKAETIIAHVKGSARCILAAERVALNFLTHLSGVATLTSQYVAAVKGTGVKVADTRKTTPGLRLLEKAAVRAGGGTNHRLGLDDGILIKDNHLALAKGGERGGGVSEVLRRAREGASHLLKVEVEVEDIQDLREALRAGADAVLLDNMGPEAVREAVKVARSEHPEVLIEVSGGVNLESVRRYAEAGPNLISVGALTHSAPAVDISLEVELR